MKTLRSMTVLQVSNVEASAAFYARLGFHAHGIWPTEDNPDEGGFCVTQRGDVTLGLQLLRGPLRVNTHWAVYIYVSDVHAMHDELAAEGVEINRAPEEMPYGCTDFDIRDPDGHLIAFGQDMTQNAHGPGLGSERGRG